MPPKKNDNIESEYWETVTLTDPTTGQKFSQKVKITKYKTPESKSKSITEELEEDAVTPLPEEDFEDQE